MALQATGVWEIRDDGNANNGGYYDPALAGAGTDYTQQAAAQLSLTDLACESGSTTLTSATGGFTAAMIGNAIHITSGTNLTAGWYVITARTDTNTVTLDRTPTSGGAGSSGVGAVGGALPWADASFNSGVAGNRWWVRSGTYTLTGAFAQTLEGTQTGALYVEGYSSTRGDAPTCDNRPLVACGANAWTWNGDYSDIAHLRFTTTTANGISLQGNHCVVRRCCSTNSSATAGRAALYGGPATQWLVECEGVSANGHAFTGGSSLCGCYGHDSREGYHASIYSAITALIGCVFADCSVYGALLSAINSGQFSVIACTIDNCASGVVVTGTTQQLAVLLGNLITNNGTVGVALASGAVAPRFVDRNNYYGNAADRGFGVPTGANDTALDPQYVDRANGDYAPANASLAAAGWPVLGTAVGLAAGAVNHTYPGAIQPVRSAGGGVAFPLGL